MGSGDINQTIVAIDGPAGVGKSSVSRRVAAVLKFMYLDTGAMYRAVTLACLRRGIDLQPQVDSQIADLLASVELVIQPDGTLLLDGQPLTEELRSAAVSEHVSAVSALPVVRNAMVEMQRNFAESMVAHRKLRGVVVDGRDIGSHVFPAARHRFYLDATVAERARRRAAQEPERGLAMDAWIRCLARRDRFDSERKLAPLKVADGAKIIDTTHLSEDEVVQEIVELVGS